MSNSFKKVISTYTYIPFPQKEHFKAFTFSLRSGAVDRAPPGWLIKTENKEDLMQLGQIISKEMKIDDLL